MKIVTPIAFVLVVLIATVYPAVAAWEKFDVPPQTNSFSYSNGWYIAATATGVFRTQDLSTEWVRVSDAMANERVYFVLCDAGRLIAVNETSILISTNGGENWDTAPASFPAREGLYAMFMVGDEMYAYYGTRLLRTADHGATWSDMFRNADGSIVTGKSYAIAPRGFMYAVGNGNDYSYDYYLYSTTNAGATWVQSSERVSDVPMRIWAASNGDLYMYDAWPTSYFYDYNPTLKVSTNNGATFTDLNFGEYKKEAECFLEINGTVMIATTTEGTALDKNNGRLVSGVHFTIDRGVTWSDFERKEDELRFLSLQLVNNKVVGMVSGGQYYWASVPTDITCGSMDDASRMPSNRSEVRCIKGSMPQTRLNLASESVISTYDVLGRWIATQIAPAGLSLLNTPIPTMIHVYSIEGHESE